MASQNTHQAHFDLVKSNFAQLLCEFSTEVKIRIGVQCVYDLTWNGNSLQHQSAFSYMQLILICFLSSTVHICNMIGDQSEFTIGNSNILVDIPYLFLPLPIFHIYFESTFASTSSITILIVPYKSNILGNPTSGIK